MPAISAKPTTKINGVSLTKAKAEELALDHLIRVQISDQAQKFPGQLSGGQQQRAAIARALCMAVSYTHLTLPTSDLV